MHVHLIVDIRHCGAVLAPHHPKAGRSLAPAAAAGVAGANLDAGQPGGLRWVGGWVGGSGGSRQTGVPPFSCTQGLLTCRPLSRENPFQNTPSTRGWRRVRAPPLAAPTCLRQPWRRGPRRGRTSGGGVGLGCGVESEGGVDVHLSLPLPMTCLPPPPPIRCTLMHGPRPCSVGTIATLSCPLLQCCTFQASQQGGATVTTRSISSVGPPAGGGGAVCSGGGRGTTVGREPGLGLGLRRGGLAPGLRGGVAPGLRGGLAPGLRGGLGTGLVPGLAAGLTGGLGRLPGDLHQRMVRTRNA